MCEQCEILVKRPYGWQGGPWHRTKTHLYKLTGQRRVPLVPFMLLQKSYISTIHTTAQIISVVKGAENKWAGVEEDLYYKPLN